MFPSEKRAPTLCLSPHFIPTPYCALTAITPWPSLTLWLCPTRLQPIPTRDRYWGPLGGCSSADLCDIRCALLMLHCFLSLLRILCTGLALTLCLCGTWCVSAGPAQGLHRHEKLQQPQNSYSLPIQRERRPKWHRGEAPAAKRQTGVRSLWREDREGRVVGSYTDKVL